MASIIQTNSNQKPTLVFCATKKGVQQSGSVLAKDAKFIMSIEHKQRLQKCANSLQDSKPRDLVMYGVGFHLAGMDVSDRKKLKVLLSLETYQCFVTLISKSKEFSDVQLRVKEKRTLNTLNKDKNRITIRIPIDGKIKNEMKVNWEVCLSVLANMQRRTFQLCSTN